MIPIRAIAVIAAAAGGCVAPAPMAEVTSVDPGEISDTVPQSLGINGQNFMPRVSRVNFDQPADSTVNVDFGVLLVNESGDRTPLDGVQYRSNKLLRATVNVALTPGVYDVVVIDPHGREVTGVGVLTISLDEITDCPGEGVADLCDGVDTDCDGLTDEDHVIEATMCGVGACANNVGEKRCADGVVEDTCDPFSGAAAVDVTCDGIDDDCDGSDDEDYAQSATSCGVGLCAGNAGVLQCSNGSEVDTCDPFAGAAGDDTTCDAVDDDCDGSDDEDYAESATSCGVGLCAGNAGVLQCSSGSEVDTCDPFIGAAAADATCDGVDDDCDGSDDEDYATTPTGCGVGACAANTGQWECQGGNEVDTCDPMAGAAADDTTCDTVDDDCDGTDDEDYVVVATLCGVGDCAGNIGDRQCVGGLEIDSCDPYAGASQEGPFDHDSCADFADNDCDGSADLADAGCSFNMPPIASLTITPPVGGPGTAFLADASASTDAESGAGSLTYAWDWDDDGTFDDTGVTSSQTLSASGIHPVHVAVSDPAGLVAWKTFLVVVASLSDILVVTTALDESDGGATVLSPGSTGLSLREAMLIAEATPGTQSIWIPGGTAIQLGSPLPILNDDAGVQIVGDGSSIDGSSMGPGLCIEATADFNAFFGLELTGCNDLAALHLNGSADFNQVSRCWVHDNAQGITADGNAEIGPNNLIEGNTAEGIGTRGPVRVWLNVIRSNGEEGVRITASADGTVVERNLIYLNGTQGIVTTANPDNMVLRHNTIARNGDEGIKVGGGVTGAVCLNNILWDNSGWGIGASDGNFAEVGYNAYLDNTLGSYSGGAPGTGSVVINPGFVDASNGDYRLLPDSPLIDAGTDTGIDVNDAAPNTFNGPAPDIGGWEW